MAAQRQVDVRVVGADLGVPVRGVVAHEDAAVALLGTSVRLGEVGAAREAEGFPPVLHAHDGQFLTVALDDAVFVAEQVPAHGGVGGVEPVHVFQPLFLRPAALVEAVVVVAQHAEYAVLSLDLLENIDEGLHFVGAVVDQVAGHADHVRVLAVNERDGVVQGAGARPATGVHIADLDDLVALEGRWEVLDRHVDGEAAVAVGVANNAVGQGRHGHAPGHQGGFGHEAAAAGVALGDGTHFVDDPGDAAPQIVQQEQGDHRQLREEK